MLRFGKFPVCSNCFSSLMNCAARKTSGMLQPPARGVGDEVGPQRFDGRAAGNLDRAGLVDEVAVAVQDAGAAALRLVPPMRLGDGELAVVAQCLAVRDDIVPDEPGGRIGQRVHGAVGPAEGIAAGEAGEGALHVIVGHGAVRPLMAVGAENARAIGVVEQDELTHHLVVVGRDLLAEDAERRVAVALGQIAEHLVVGAVLLDDVDDVLEDARFADALGHGPGRLVRARRQLGLLQQTVAQVAARRSGSGATIPARSARARATAVPKYRCELNLTGSPGLRCLVEPMPLMLATQSALRPGRKRRRRGTSRRGSARAGWIGRA